MSSEMKESAVMERLGVPSRTTMRGLRKQLCVEGVDFNREGITGVVIYTAPGLKKIADALGASAGAEKNDAGAERVDDAPTPFDSLGGATALQRGAAESVSEKNTGDGRMELVCTEWRFRNVNIIEAKDAQGAVWTVRVHDNTKFRPGMKFHAKATHAGHAIIHGRGPRWAGRM